MLGFFKKLFGAKTVDTVPAPYKVEVPVIIAVDGAGAVEIKPAVKKTAKKPAAKTATTRKPKTPKV
jgi:hypothetical protein